MGYGINGNSLDPRLELIADTIKEVRAELNDEEFSKAWDDINYEVELYRPKSKKNWFHRLIGK